MIYLLTAIGLTPGGSSTVHIYIQTIHRTTKQQYTQPHKYVGRMGAAPGPCELFPGICLATEEKARKNLRQYDYVIAKVNNYIQTATVFFW